MKFLFLTLFTFLISTSSVFAQQVAKETYGIKAGSNFAELYGADAIPESDRKVGYSIGGYANFAFSKTFSLQPEMIWSLQGETSKDSGRYKISYLNIPVMMKWKEGSFYYEAGPQLGLLVVSSSKSVPEAIRVDNFETFEFSLAAGVGYTLDKDWAIGLRYTQGLTNIVSGMELKNSVLYFGVSYALFRL